MLEELLSTLRDNVTNRESDKVRIIRLPFLVQTLFSLVPDLKSQFLATTIGGLYEGFVLEKPNSFFFQEEHLVTDQKSQGVITTLSTAC